MGRVGLRRGPIKTNTGWAWSVTRGTETDHMYLTLTVPIESRHPLNLFHILKVKESYRTFPIKLGGSTFGSSYSCEPFGI